MRAGAQLGQITLPGIDKACLCSEATVSWGGLHGAGWCTYLSYLVDTEPFPPLVIRSVLPLIWEERRLLCLLCLCEHKAVLFVLLFFVKPHPDKWLVNVMCCPPHCFYCPQFSEHASRKSLPPPRRVTNLLQSNNNTGLSQIQGGAINARDVECDSHVIVGKCCTSLNGHRSYQANNSHFHDEDSHECERKNTQSPTQSAWRSTRKHIIEKRDLHALRYSQPHTHTHTHTLQWLVAN